MLSLSYGYISHLKINYTKSEAMNLTFPTNTLTQAQQNNPFKWVSGALKYLGIGLTPLLSNIFSQNFRLMLRQIELNLSKWSVKFFSWFGRAAITKMVILPRLLYLFHTLPINIPDIFF